MGERTKHGEYPSEDRPAKAAVVGLGYIGLPTAALLADQGLEVVGVDIKPDLVEAVNRGQVSSVEPGLADLVCSVVKAGRLRAALTPEPAEVFIIAMPTPLDGNRRPDLRFVEAAVSALAPVLQKGNLIILESTSPVGTTEEAARRLQAARPDLKAPQAGREEGDLFIAYCPERILPGRMLKELRENGRVVGGINRASAAKAARLYELFVRAEVRQTRARTAEMVKLVENAFRDLNIAFANELSVICRELGIDVWELVDLANRHPRVNILNPGPGVGGHCIAVDPWFIVDRSPNAARLIKLAREVNDARPALVVDEILRARDELLARRPGRREPEIKAALLGLTYKADVDDLRESPALTIAEQLINVSAMEIHLVEPHIRRLPALCSGARLAPLDEALDGADLVVQLVGHTRFVGLAGRLRPEQIFINCVGPGTAGKEWV